VDKFSEAEQIMRDASRSSDGCIVFFSGGKDSLVVMDMASRIFKKVVPVFMYFVPGLKVIERQLEYARQRWNTEIIQVPHWTLFRCLKAGYYSLPRASNDNIPDVKLKDIYDMVMTQTGLSYIATGAKAADSVWRKQNLHSTDKYTFLLTPIKNWNKFDVLYYLNAHKIPIPESESKNGRMSGVGLTYNSILWLHDKHPEDFELMEQVFPFIGAVVARRKFYGQ
jgi:phosphoadenosine phosphosulfate reductase